MPSKPTEIVGKLLANTTNLEVVKQLVAEDATYVSLNYNNPILTKIEPWCGTHEKVGPQAIYQTFIDVGRYWSIEKFETYALFGEGENVAVFGRFVYKSNTIGKISDSPFGIWAKVDEAKGKVTYMQFMEDTLSSSASFAKSGSVVYASNPDGEEVTIDIE